MRGDTTPNDSYERPPGHGPRTGPRLYHRKSRLGCTRCKARRVKCDETKPTCGGCKRHSVQCVYLSTDNITPTNTNSNTTSSRRRHDQRDEPSNHVHSNPYGSPSEHSDMRQPCYPQNMELSPTSGTAPNPAVSKTGNGFLSVSSEHAPVSSPHTSAQPAPSPGESTWSEQQASGWSRESSTRLSGTTSNGSSAASSSSEARDYLSSLASTEVTELPESKERRVFELRLMHNYMNHNAQQFANLKANAHHGEQPKPGVAMTDAEVQAQMTEGKGGLGRFIWGREIPLLAFKNDAIMYSMFAVSALDMWTRASDQKEKDELRLLQQKYLYMALREQRIAVGNLSKDNADMICMAALTILQNSFALVQTLETSPWQPPLEWLQMGKGAGAVLTIARGYVGSDNNDNITRFVESGPWLDPNEVFAAEHRTHLLWLLENDGGSADDVGGHELKDPVTTMVYHKVLSYIGSAQKAIADKEAIFKVLRRFIGFSMFASDLFHSFLVQRRPRALVVLAHFFKLWIPYDDLQLVGKTGENQVRGILDELPLGWKHKVAGIFGEYGLKQ
ncbi:hypothetical protein BD289DRAFT_144896 [Coniella lustricola]|uniref:Zn(2)-C6 fungal-type domain-containing protein n=1 Tax=Coniella lustricola TaxID=2025994 RepID=A0A2T3AF18_9PEZI|nr:hypothetical protein BD289DRAFT_144896 [Coniella lustricola]